MSMTGSEHINVVQVNKKKQQNSVKKASQSQHNLNMQAVKRESNKILNSKDSLQEAKPMKKNRTKEYKTINDNDKLLANDAIEEHEEEHAFSPCKIPKSSIRSREDKSMSNAPSKGEDKTPDSKLTLEGKVVVTSEENCGGPLSCKSAKQPANQFQNRSQCEDVPVMN